MKIENQVCTLEQAKKLAELLGKHAPESLWVWTETRYQTGVWLILNEDYRDDIVLDTVQEKRVHSWYSDEFYPAYTGDELGALLPAYLYIENYETILTTWKLNQSWAMAYDRTEDGCCLSEIFDAEHEAHAKADLAISLLEQKIIKPEDFKYLEGV